MRLAHTVEQIRAAEAALMATVPDGTLMQRAAAGLAAATLDLLGSGYGRRVRLLVGAGDNGGDALFAGALLARRGALVEAVLLAPQRAHPAGLAALLAAGGRVLADAGATEPAPDVVIDGIVGIGGSGGLRPAAVAALAAVPGVPIVAVDVPSGVGVDSAQTPDQHVRAAVTVSFGSLKAAHLADPAAAACGAVQLVDIGLGPHLAPPALISLQQSDVPALLPQPAPAGHKYTRGVVGLRTGSARYPGAGELSVAGASCGLAGMVRYVGGAADLVRAAHPEVVGEGRVQAWVTGCGGGDGAAEALAACLADRVPVVVDADALRHFPAARPRSGAACLTPHAGELAGLLGVDRAEIEAAPLAHVRRAAAELDAVVLLKGRITLVAHPDGRVGANHTGVAWLGTAGAGDVLAGLIGALLATGLDPFDAALVGAWLHGRAATLAGGGGPVVAGEVARALPGVVRDLVARRAARR